MQVKDPRLIQTLLDVQNKSRRQLAEAVGYASHAYINLILNGDVTTMKPEKAIRVAEYLGVGVDFLFVPRTSSVAGHNVRPKVTA
jgi:transcriptional regulator with XRE-family HTH domain